MKIRGNGFVLLACLAILSSCGKENTEKPKTKAKDTQEFTVTVKQEIPSIDASVTNDVVGWGVLKNVGEGLFRAGQDGDLVPAGAAAEPEISEDGLIYTFKLREDALWSNGDPIVAADYVYGWQRTADPITASEVAYLFTAIENYDAIAAEEMPVEDLGIKALGDNELEIHLAYPVPYIQSLLSLPPFFPQNQSVVEEHGENYANESSKAVYNGPFVLTDFEGAGVDTSWAYEKNDQYWDKKNVKMDKIKVEVVKEDSTALNLFQDGQVDDIVISGELAQQMQNDEAFFSQEMSSVYYVEYNQDRENLKNENLRKALSYSIDREALVEKILGDGSIAVTGLVPKNMSFNPETASDFVEDSGAHLAHDEKKAQELWALAKSELGVETITLELLSSDADSAKKVVEYMQGAIQDTLDGVTIKVSSVPLSVRLDRGNNGDFDMIFVGWGAEYDDPSVFLELFMSDNINNSGKYSNADFDKDMKDSATTNADQPSERWSDLLSAQETLMDTMGVCPIYQKAESHLRNPKLKGILPAGPEFDYKWTYLEK